jgi:hypothetical protein
MFKAPNQTPLLSVMCRDLGSRGHAVHVAALLGVHERTVYGWLAKDQMPRAAALALFWETTWGRQWNHANGHTELSLMAQRIEGLKTEVSRLHGRIAYLENIGRFDSANAPTLTPAPFWPQRQSNVIPMARAADLCPLSSEAKGALKYSAVAMY